MPLLQFDVKANYDEVIRLRNEIDNLENTLKSFGPGTAESTIRSLQIQLSQCRDQFQKLISDAANAGASVERTVSQSLANVRKNGNINVSVKADTNDFHYRMMETDKDFQDVMKNLDSYSAKLTSAFANLSSLAGFTAPLVGVLGFLNQVKETRTYFQDIESTMTVLLGSEEKSLEFCQQLEAAAYWNMFEYADLVGASKQMIAYGVATDQIIPKINQLSEVATATKGSLDEMVGMYNRAKAIGYVDSRALQTWATHGLVVKDVLKEMGEEAHGNKVTFEQLNKVLDHVTGEGGMFHDVMKSQMSNISAEIGQLEDNTSLMFNEIGKDLQEPLVKVIKIAGKLVEHWKTVAGVLATAGAAYGVMHAARSADSKAFNSELEETRKKLEAVHEERQRLTLDKDIQKGLDAGKYSREDAEELQNNRNALNTLGAGDKTIKQLQEEARQRMAVAEAIDEEKRKLVLLKDEHGTAGEGLKDGLEQTPLVLDSDLQSQVSSGMVSQEDADSLQKMRDEINEIAEARSKAAESVAQEVLENTELNQICQQQLADAQAKKDAADQNVAKIEEQLRLQQALDDYAADTGNDEVREQIEERVTALDLENAMKEQAVAASELLTAQEDAEAAAQMVQNSVTQQNTLARNAQTISEQANTAAKTTNTAATNANTGSENINSATKTKNAIVTRLATVADGVATTAKLMYKNAVDSVTRSLHALKAAAISNPLGALLTLTTTIIGLFMTFKDETEEVSEEVERFGESAVKTKSNVDTLFAVLEATDASSKTHKDAMAELEKKYKDYNIVLDDNVDKEQQLIAKKSQLIKLIMEEGRQRQIANNIASMQEQKDDSYDTFREELTKNIDKGTKDEGVKASSSTIVSTWLDKIEDKRGELVEMITNLDAKEKELTNEYAKGQYQDYAKSAELRKEIQEARNKLMSDLNADARAIMEKQGKKIGKDWTLDLNDAYQTVKKMVVSTEAANKAMADYTAQSKDNANQLRRVAVHTEIDYAGKSVKELTSAYLEAQRKAKELNDTKVEPPANPINIDKLFKSAHSAKEKLDEANNTNVAPGSDNTKIDETTHKATEAGEKLNDIDNTIATPQIDMKYIDIALDKLNDVKIILREVGGQVLNTTFEERQQLARLMKKYGGEDGRIAPGTMMAKDDADLYNSIIKNARMRSSYKMGGEVYDLNRNQSAILQQFLDKYGTQLDPTKMEEGDARLYKSWRNDIRKGAIKAGGKRAQDEQVKMLEELKRQTKDATTENQITQLSSDIREQMKDLDPKSEFYKELKSLTKTLDKKNPSKKNGGSKDDPKQRAYEKNKMEEAEAERLAKQERDNDIEREKLRISMLKDGAEKEIAQIRLDARKKREALEDEKKKEAERLEELDKKLWLKSNKGKHEYDWKPQKSKKEYEQLASDILGIETSLSEIAYNESTGIQEQYRKDMTAMRDYLKEYGTFEQRKLAIAQEYEEKIRNATTQGERFKLEQEKSTAIEGVDMEALKSQIDWYSVFDNVGLVMKSQLEPLYKRLQEYVKTDAFRTSGASNQKDIVDAMENIRSQIGESQGWRDLATALKEYQGALLKLKEAEEKNKLVIEKQSSLQNQYKKADAELKTLTGQDYEAIAQAQANLEKARESGDSNSIADAEDVLNALTQLGDANAIKSALDALDKARQELNNYSQTVAESTQNVADAQSNLSGTGMQLSQTAKNVTQPISEIYTFLNDYGLPQLAELWHQFDLLKGGIDGLNALKSLKDASENAETATENIGKLGDGVKDAPQKIGDAAKDVADSIGDSANDIGDATKDVTDNICNMANIGDATKDVAKSISGAAKDSAKNIGDAGKDVTESVEDIDIAGGLSKAGLIGQIVSAALSILEMLKDGIGTFIANLIDTILSSITGILDNLLSGEFIKQIGESLIKGIGGIFKSVTTMGGLFDWWGSEDSDPHLEEDIERLTLTNEALKDAIEELTEEMRDGASISEIKSKYQKAQADFAASTANTQEMMARTGRAYKSGFLGIGGDHSSNHEINKEMSSRDWARVSKAAGVAVHSATDFFNLSAENMAKVKKEVPDLYAKIKDLASKGYKDASQYMDKYGTPTNPCVLRYAYKRSYPNILDSLNTKNGRSATPLSSDRNLFITALKDSAKALVERD